MSSVELPDGWYEAEYDPDEYHAVWASDDDQIAIEVVSDARNTEVVYPITIHQHVAIDGYSAPIQTGGAVAQSRRDAESMVEAYMNEVNDGEHRLHVYDYEIWEEFVQFYCISDSELPDDVTGEQVVEAFENDAYEPAGDSDVDPEQHSGETINVSIFPKHKTAVDGYDD